MAKDRNVRLGTNLEFETQGVAWNGRELASSGNWVLYDKNTQYSQKERA
mgnify:CR=1 FL=1